MPSPLPGAPKRVLPVAAPALEAPALTAGMVRLHREEQVLEDVGLVEDNFVWANTITSSRTETFTLRNPVPGAAARFSVEVRAARWPASYAAEAWLNGDQAGAATLAFSSSTQQDSVRLRVRGESTAAVAGQNSLTLRNALTGDGQLLALDSFGVMAATRLDVGDGRGPLEFALWGDDVPAPATAADLRVAAAVPADLLLWDVSVPDSALALAGTPGTGQVTYGLSRDPGLDRHFVAARRGDLQRPAAGRRVQPVDLRSRPVQLDHVVVAPEGFINAAEDLADYRTTAVPGVASPAAAAVLVDDIYDNFAGGQKDWRAIRDYLHWVYEQGGQRLRYACLLGNASRDPRNWKNKTPYVELADLVPTQIRTEFPGNPTYPYASPYASDDGLVSFDAVNVVGYIDYDVPDVACGRLPALTPAEARDMVDRAIAYDRFPVTGTWRNRVVLVADDANIPGYPYPLGSSIEPRHTRQAEVLAENYVPQAVDVVKIYAAAYPFPPGSRIKPAVRAEINAVLGTGATMYYYVGHGAEDNLADEQIFRSQDIAGMNNGMQRFVFLAFSCDVGVYDSLVRRSMAEQFVAASGGGAIAAICASQVSFVTSNEIFSNAFYANLYPGRGVDPERSLGEALRLGKASMVSVGLRDNSQRYNLTGDPATTLPHPDDSLAFAAASLDTLRTGQLHRAVVAAAGVAGVAYDLEVSDSDMATGIDLYTQVPDPLRPGELRWEATGFLPWFANGAPVFRGSGSVGAGDLEIPFKAPLQLGLGERGRVRAIIRSTDGDHSAVDRVPVVSGGTGPADDVLGPAITLAFADEATRVQPGDVLEAVLADSSGIAMLGTSPGNSILLEFDDSGFMTNVTASFAYDPDSYTRGRLAFGLPSDLAPGRHTAALYAADALGNVGSDTLSFALGAAGAADLGPISVFPNPTAGPCRLVFELSDPMAVRWDIYTVAGRRIRSVHERLAGAGPGILAWDGRDAEGDEIANGTYLYV
ncbi:MAG: C25 family cysteine peptidase, partial [Candidatus Krumholzibacteriia bacterium]